MEIIDSTQPPPGESHFPQVQPPNRQRYGEHQLSVSPERLPFAEENTNQPTPTD
jgi:hypothetical protein